MGERRNWRAYHTGLEGKSYAVTEGEVDADGNYPVIMEGDDFSEPADTLMAAGIIAYRNARGKNVGILYSEDSGVLED